MCAAAFQRLKATLSLSYRIRGFLHYHAPPHLDPTAGQVRFRPTKTGGEPETSDIGGGLPWHIPLIHVASMKELTPLGEELVAQGFVSCDLLARCRRLGKTINTRAPIVHRIGEPFPLHFDASSTGAWIVRDDTARFLRLRYLFENKDPALDPAVPHFPFSGSAVVRFETAAAKKGPKLVLRIVEVLDPIRTAQADRRIEVLPLHVIEGKTLVPRLVPDTAYREHAPWCWHRDEKQRGFTALELLFDEQGNPRVFHEGY
ncbi:hypothetical protein DFH07DRAFT_842223 [Mycena maculata]|uniref:Uncharacterized protein n=1 Tax=Mycena maculata TaxID=230809 RepID=A0AAD7I8I9_9AGAR|nr:hypothetical protein DFH07DRAFT_842223 [Mycena maculata]